MNRHRLPHTTPPARRRLLVAALGVAGLGVPGLSTAAAFDLPQLMALLAQRKSGEARFSEERYVGGLDGPLRSRGTLSFNAPDRFARHTTEPRPESMEVDGNTLRLRRGDRTRQMSLDAIPELAGLVDALRGTLSGDARTLQRQFEARVSGQPQRWTLLLTPRDARLAAQIRSLEIVGQGPALRSVEMQMSGGDRSLMLIDAPTP